MKNRLIILTMTATTFVSSFGTVIKPAHASFGDFMLGVGAAVGVGAIVDSNRRAAERRYKPVPPQQEYYRGREDGINGAKYDNPRSSPDYDRGYEEGARRRRGR